MSEALTSANDDRLTKLFRDQAEREFFQSWSGVQQHLLYGLATSILDEKLQDTLVSSEAMMSESAGLTEKQMAVFFHVAATCLRAVGDEFKDKLLAELRAKNMDFLTVK